MSKAKGGFTLPGEAGYEGLTLELAEKWGADVIRDSDGTALSEEITSAGYGIYSTLCVIRDHNQWAAENPGKLQQTFLSTSPRTADGDVLDIPLMEEFFAEQFAVNDSPEAMEYWQVYDRTDNSELPRDNWSYCPETGRVRLSGVTLWHKYSVNFMAWRVWEEISMYNHNTNGWDKEHLMQIDPIYPETQAYLENWLENWCAAHPATTVVRFTSLFYNFAWIWGANERNRTLFTDWASYDFTVSPRALDTFRERYSYGLTGEDFVNKGMRRSGHMPPDQRKRDWMEFVNDFVISFGRRLVDIVHGHGKQAYVFYDDSWVGLEPYNGRFAEFGFDGLIKCVFSGYEARLCSGVGVETHELRLHPYLFPVGLGGMPTFSEGGDPARDARVYWSSVRRALLREPVERIGLGGYLHLTEDYPDFRDYIESLSDEFRAIRDLHREGAPYALKPRVAVLHAWGALRSWTLSGHFHETFMHDLIHINESLSGLPLEVRFIGPEDLAGGVPDDIDIIINAGYKGSAWSGGDMWRNDKLVAAITEWVHGGGAFVGVNEPSALDGYDTGFRLAHLLGVDRDYGERVCHGRWSFEVCPVPGLMPGGASIRPRDGIYLTGGGTRVLVAAGEMPLLTENAFGRGRGIYMSAFEHTPPNARMLLNALLYACGEPFGGEQAYVPDSLYTECAWFPQSGRLAVANNSGEPRKTSIITQRGQVECELEPYGFQVLEVD